MNHSAQRALSKHNARRALIAAGLALSLSACVVAPVDYGYGEPIAVADAAPPAPYGEAPSAAPYAGAVWIGGYWGWNSGRYHWVPGRWDRGRPGYVWRPYRWQPYGGRWHLHGGGWVHGR
jgi:hypothetical protein